MAESRVAVITGASKGIGLETARHLASSGWNIALCSRSEKESRDVALSISGQFGVDAIGVGADVSSSTDMENFARSVAQSWTSVNLVVCNAAILGPVGTVADVSPTQILAEMTANYLGVTNSIRTFWSLLIREPGFRIVTLAGGGLGGPGQMLRAPAYVPSKAAVAALVEISSDEIGEVGGTINAIAPGNIPTLFMHSVLDAGVNAAGKELFGQAADREGKDIGESLRNFLELVDFIASDDSSPVNGRFLSARWNSPTQLRAAIKTGLSDSMFRLRRIDNDLYSENIK